MGVIAPADGSESLSLAEYVHLFSFACLQAVCFLMVLCSSIAFDGKLLYVIDRETTIKSFTASIPTTEVDVLQMPGARITCLGIGHAE